MHAVKSFMQMTESESLAAANKRIANILKSAKDSIPEAPDPAHLSDAEERALYERLQAVTTEIAPLRESGAYEQSLKLLANLREPVDNFFDHVMVMDEDPVLRANRLALLSNLRNLFMHTADFSKLQ